METVQRMPLRKGSMIELYTFGKRKTSEEFTILSETPKEGGSCLCYEAANSNGDCGRLKEFYPHNPKNYRLVRETGSHQLLATSGQTAVFEEDCGEMVETYRLLQEIRNTQTAINHYIPSFELYFGADDNSKQKGSVYVWTKNDKNGQPFSEYLAELPEKLENSDHPEQFLRTILESLLALSRCIRTLHGENLYHLDIKPENFALVLDERGTPIPGAISLFDINSLYLFGTRQAPRFIGSQGFCAPELAEGQPVDESDLYSIGATLFAALFCGAAAGVSYDSSQYDQLSLLLPNSPILQQMETEAGAELLEHLQNILQNCLAAHPQERYPMNSYDGLVSDLEQALSQLQPLSSEEEVAKQQKSGAAGAIQRLLFEHPLYDYCDGERLNLLVLGAGAYARKFIDIALEAAQIKGIRINVTVVSDQIERDKAQFLAARPAFTQFFTVDAIMPPSKQPLGLVRFLSTNSKEQPQRRFDKASPNTNQELIDQLMPEDALRRSHYVFVALGSDLLSKEIAELCRQRADALRQKPFVAYMQCHKHRGKGKATANPLPVYADEGLSASPYYQQLRRMAFHCHLIWRDEPLSDLQSAAGSFRSPYNSYSSLSNALSIKYKLHSIGISLGDFSEASLRKAAAMFKEYLTNDAQLGELAMYEHRRWLCNCISEGWQPLCEEDYVKLTMGTKLKDEKQHPCMVLSGENWALSTRKWKENCNERWSMPLSPADNLDALDTMSIQLHQHFINLAKNLKQQDIIRGLDTLRSMIPSSQSNVADLMNAFVFATSELLSSQSASVGPYRLALRQLKKQLSELPEELRKPINKELGRLEDLVFPLVESQNYTDYKAKDMELIRNIPFILTYTSSIRLFIPLRLTSGDDLQHNYRFKNVAAAMLLNPSVITYVVNSEEFYGREQGFIDSVLFAANSMRGHRLQTVVDFLFLENVVAPIKEGLCTTLCNLAPNVRNVEVLSYQNDKELGKVLTTYLQKQQASRRPFHAIERNHSATAHLLRGYSVYDAMPDYHLQYEGTVPTFETTEVEYFDYVPKSGKLTVQEMFSSQNVHLGFAAPELPDFQFFWKQYHTADIKDTQSTREGVWKGLCGILRKRAELDDVLATVDIPRYDKGDAHTFRMVVPAICYPGLKIVMDGLRKLSPYIIGSNPTLTYYSSQSFLFTFAANDFVYKSICNLLSKPYYLQDSSICVIRKLVPGKAQAQILFANLTVSPFSMDCLKEVSNIDSASILSLLRVMNQSGKIIALREDVGTNTISFTYSSPQIKDLLTNEGRILELYVFYQALAENYFDDIKMGAHITDAEGIDNEFDIVLTKGYKTMIVECKATIALNQNYYYKLAQLTRRYGVNAQAVLVADTLEDFNWRSIGENNAFQRTRGNEYHVTTIYKYRDIEHIGKCLRELIEASQEGYTARR